MDTVVEGSMDDPWSNFAAHFDDKLIKRLLRNKSPETCLDVDKYSYLWQQIHQKAISVDDLLAYFPDRQVATSQRCLGRSAVQRMKNKGECPVPGEDALAILSKVYEDSLRSRCTYFMDSPTVREQLLDSFCRSDGQTSGVFSLSNYPWITATPDVPPIMVQGKSILIHCETLDGPEWINSKIVAPGLPAMTPESKALAAVKRKMQCLMHIMKECLADLFPHPVALLYLADSSGAIHYEEEFDYDPAIKRGIHLAACTYTDEVYNCLRRSSTLRGFGELKTWQQPKKKFKIGSVVFDVKGHRPFPGCFGRVIKMDNDNIYVDWNGTDGNGRNYPCKKANLRLVPILKIVPPTHGGELVAISGGTAADRYGKIVKVVDCSPADDNRVRVEDATGATFRVHRQFLHVVEKASQQETQKEHAGYGSLYALRLRVPPKVDEYTWLKKTLGKRFRSHYIVDVRTYEKKARNEPHVLEFATDSSVYITASSDSGRESEEEEGIEICDSHGRMCNFVHDKRLQMQFMSSDKAFKFTGKDVRDTFIINYQDTHRWFGNDAVDIFVSYLNFRYPERTSGVHAVPSFSTAAMLGKSAEQQMKLWSFYARREGLYESKPRMLLVPLNTSNIHWSLAVVGNPFAPADLFVLHVDSQGMGKDTLTSGTEGFIKSLVQTLSEHDERIKIHQSEKAQQQQDSHSCGPFTVFFMEGLATEFGTSPPAALTLSWAEETISRVSVSPQNIQSLRNAMLMLATGLEESSEALREHENFKTAVSGSSESIHTI